MDGWQANQGFFFFILYLSVNSNVPLSSTQGLYHADQRFGPGVISYPDGREDVGLWLGESLLQLCASVEKGFSLRNLPEYAAYMDPSATTDSLIQVHAEHRLVSFFLWILTIWFKIIHDNVLTDIPALVSGIYNSQPPLLVGTVLAQHCYITNYIYMHLQKTVINPSVPLLFYQPPSAAIMNNYTSQVA